MNRGRRVRYAPRPTTPRLASNLLDVEVFEMADAGPQHAKNSYASVTPAVEGNRVYVHCKELAVRLGRYSRHGFGARQN